MHRCPNNLPIDERDYRNPASLEYPVRAGDSPFQRDCSVPRRGSVTSLQYDFQHPKIPNSELLHVIRHD